jgi:hypothetical protein
MRKTALGGLVLVAVSLTACSPAAGTKSPSGSPAPAPSVVALAPDATQTKNNVREWHVQGGDKVQVPLVSDLKLSQDTWIGDEFKRNELTKDVVRDTKAAMDYRPIPDELMQTSWVDLLAHMKQAGQEMQEGAWDKAATDLQAAGQDYKKIYDRNQAVFAGK